jgi:hypothetical protein
MNDWKVGNSIFFFLNKIHAGDKVNTNVVNINVNQKKKQ